MALSAVVGRWSTFKFERVIDPDSRQAFLLIQTQPARYPAVFHLWPLPGQQSVTTIMPKPTRAGVDAYIDSRTGWLEVR
ncbi:MAG: hypothetical protein HY815_02010 [Candidatus Riflebacteria bacterium]|nr:hypothetical protein [Candidatus Riflebacteria bacterium]